MLQVKEQLMQMKEFLGLFVEIPNEKIVAQIMEDFFTPAEIETFVNRWQIVKMLDKGIPQKEISEKLGVGIATITHGSLAFKRGGEGFRWLLKKNV